MKLKSYCLSALALAALSSTATAQRPSVVVTIENTAPYNGTFFTPMWVGFHDGQFDTYNGGTLASSLPRPNSVGIERLAEDGNTGPISEDFAALQINGVSGIPDITVQDTNGVQGTIRSNGTVPPIAPSQIVSRLFEVAPVEGQATYFSYATMILPSNDAFSSNGNPRAHSVYDAEGNFNAEPFYILGSEVDDAGTEANDELPQNTAFFGQQTPDTGAPGEGLISGAGGHPGFNSPIPGVNILGTSRFADGDFEQSNYNIARVKLTFLDTAAPVLFNANIDTQFESPQPVVTGNPNGRAFFFLDDDGESLVYFAFANGLTGDLTAAHLHLAPLTQSGPVVLPLQTIFGRFVFGRISADDVVGPLAGEEGLNNLIAEMTAGSSYINLHTAANPAGEIRGQVHLNPAQ